MNREETKSIEYREQMENQLARDFWFMTIGHPDFTWEDADYIFNCLPIEFGNGWLKLLYEFCNSLKTEVKSNFDIHQLKEKWGFANVYYSGDITPYGEQLIKEFEEESKHTCEVCGQPANIEMYAGWARCLCEDCKKEIEN